MIRSFNNFIFRPVQPLNGRQVEYYVENKPEPSEQRSFSWSLWRRDLHYHRCRSLWRDVSINVCSMYFFGLLNETNSNGQQRGQKMYVTPPPQNSIRFWRGREAVFQCHPPVTFFDPSSNFFSPSPSHFSLSRFLVPRWIEKQNNSWSDPFKRKWNTPPLKWLLL